MIEELILSLPMFYNTYNSGYCEPCILDNREARMNVPNAKRLNLVVENDCCFDFVLGMKTSLDYLYIFAHTWESYMSLDCRGKKRKRNETLKIWGYHNKMNKSNIWVLFPKLKEVELRAIEPGTVKTLVLNLNRGNGLKRNVVRVKI